MYNAAYFAGLQLDTHQPHSLYIDRDPPGREGTLNYPDIDLAGTNDTDAPVLVRTAYDDEGVTVTLYGDNGGRPGHGHRGAADARRGWRLPDHRHADGPLPDYGSCVSRSPPGTRPRTPVPRSDRAPAAPRSGYWGRCRSTPT